MNRLLHPIGASIIKTFYISTIQNTTYVTIELALQFFTTTKKKNTIRKSLTQLVAAPQKNIIPYIHSCKLYENTNII